LSIIALTAPLIGVGIHRALKKERYEAAVRELVTQLSLAQQTMLYADRDVLVELSAGPDGISCRLIKASVGAMGMPLGPERLLPNIDRLLWNGQLVAGKLLLPFYSSGREMPRGDLVLIRGDEARTIHLSGYPEPIRLAKAESVRNLTYGETGYEA